MPRLQTIHPFELATVVGGLPEIFRAAHREGLVWAHQTERGYEPAAYAMGAPWGAIKHVGSRLWGSST